MLTVLWVAATPSFSQKIVSVNSKDQKGQMIKKGKEKIGVWQFYEDGKLVLEYDYDVDRVIFQQSTEDKSYFYKKNEEWVPVAQLEVYPRYKGSYIQYYETIYKTLRYPRAARENYVEGVSFLSFDVDIDGKAINPKIHNSIGFGCDQEIMRIFKKTKDQWIAAVKNGETIKTKFVVPFVFSFLDAGYILNFSDNLPPASLLEGVNITLFSSKFVR